MYYKKRFVELKICYILDQRSRLSCFAALVELNDLITITRIMIQMIIWVSVRTSFKENVCTKSIGSFRVTLSDFEQLEGQEQVKKNNCENSVYGKDVVMRCKKSI